MRRAAITILLAAAVALLCAQAPQPRPQMAEEVFKNVQALKGIPVDEFMNTMGVFSAALGMSCEDCHASNDSSWANYALDSSPRKAAARRMVGMMSAINQGYFGGRQVVTCWTCHRGSDRPRVAPDLATLYDAPLVMDDVISQAPGAPAPDAVFDRYLAALGGAERLSRLTSFAAKGVSVGYGPEGYERPVEIYAQAPDRLTTIVHTMNGDSITVYDGRNGWSAVPLKPVAVMALSGDALAGARLDAELAFPARIRQALGQWRTGFPFFIDGREMRVVQGTGASGNIATLYFDAETGLLARQVRYARSAVGRSPTQIDYSDYREVAGLKMPFAWTVAWLDGKETFTLSEVQANATVDASRFTRPVR
jgi:photosynthetic reaction center cytochrome c subunit